MPNGSRSFLVLIAPLFVAGLVMVPFLIPFFDRKAKADLAEHRRAMASAAEDGDAAADGATPAASDTADVDDPSDPTAQTIRRRRDEGRDPGTGTARPRSWRSARSSTPTPKDDEVLVRVRAASVNRADLDYLGPRPGFIRPMIGMRAPRDPRMGIDVAGVVESVGAGVTRVPGG